MTGFRNRIRFDPFGRALTEVLVTVIFTFLPILLFSFPIIDRTEKTSNGAGQDSNGAEKKSDGAEGISDAADKISDSTIWENFWSYWNSGELVLPLLGLCGTIVALISLNSSLLPGWLRTVGLILVMIVVAGGGYLLGTNRGFGEMLVAGWVVATFIAYTIVVVLWFILAVIVNYGPRSSSDAEDRVEDLLNEKRRREAGAS